MHTKSLLAVITALVVFLFAQFGSALADGDSCSIQTAISGNHVAFTITQTSGEPFSGWAGGDGSKPFQFGNGAGTNILFSNGVGDTATDYDYFGGDFTASMSGPMSCTVAVSIAAPQQPDDSSSTVTIPSQASAALSVPVPVGSKSQFCQTLTIKRGGKDGNDIVVILNTQGALPSWPVMKVSFGDGSSDWPTRTADGTYTTGHSYDLKTLSDGVFVRVQPMGLGDSGECIVGFMDTQEGHNTFLASNVGPSDFLN